MNSADDVIREAWKWLPHGEHCTSLSIAYEHAEVTEEHRMAFLAGQRHLLEWLDEQGLVGTWDLRVSQELHRVLGLE